MKRSHPDRFPPGSAQQAEATRITQEINAAYKMIKQAAIHHEVPLRRQAQTASPNLVELVEDELSFADRVFFAALGLLVGGVLDLAIGSE